MGVSRLPGCPNRGAGYLGGIVGQGAKAVGVRLLTSGLEGVDILSA